MGEKFLEERLEESQDPGEIGTENRGPRGTSFVQALRETFAKFSRNFAKVSRKFRETFVLLLFRESFAKARWARRGRGFTHRALRGPRGEVGDLHAGRGRGFTYTGRGARSGIYTQGAARRGRGFTQAAGRGRGCGVHHGTQHSRGQMISNESLSFDIKLISN